MKKLFEKKNILIPGFISLLLLVLLVSGMRSLVFKQAVPFAIQRPEVTAGGARVHLQIPTLAIILGLAALLISIYILLPKEQRRRYLLGLLAFLAAGLLFLFIISQSPTSGNMFDISTAAATPITPIVTDLPETPSPEVASTIYTPPVIPAWVSLLVALAVLIPAGIGLWWLAFHRNPPDAPYAEISEIAQEALEDLDAGKDWGDTVLNCYDRMIRAVKGQRGFVRRGDLTPSELVAALEQAHLPGEPLRRLTTLFERVRYGGKQSTQNDIDEAVACLTEIIQACQEVGA